MNEYPLFAAWFDFLTDLFDRVERFPRSVRFSLSDRMVNLGLDIMEGIVEAIYTKDRKPILRRLNLHLEKMRIFVRICHVKKYVSAGQYEYLIEKIAICGKMTGGWEKSLDGSRERTV